jgi:hypothetical protein
MGTLLQVKSWLSSTFDTKDTGETSYVIGVGILRDRKNKVLGLSHKAYLKSVLKQFSVKDCNPADVPMIKGTMT